METKAKLSRFEPFCKWRTEVDVGRVNILEIHLQGFKKEQLKVRINNHGCLIICGESTTTLSSFHKETKIPKDCNADEIRAKFVRGILYITMPSKIPLKPKQETSQSNVEEDCKVEESRAGEKIMASTRHKYWFLSAVSRLAIAVVILTIVGTYVTYKCRKSGHVQNIIPEDVQEL